jgi:hypothetical protein
MMIDHPEIHEPSGIICPFVDRCCDINCRAFHGSKEEDYCKLLQAFIDISRKSEWG